MAEGIGAEGVRAGMARYNAPQRRRNRAGGRLHSGGQYDFDQQLVMSFPAGIEQPQELPLLDGAQLLFIIRVIVHQAFHDLVDRPFQQLGGDVGR